MKKISSLIKILGFSLALILTTTPTITAEPLPTDPTAIPSRYALKERKVRSDWDEQDVILIQYKLPSEQRRNLFEGCLEGSLPQMKKTKSWHLTLLMVKNVEPPHRQILKKRLKKLALTLFSSERFTPRSAMYLDTEDRSQGVIALLPQTEEEQLFRHINQALIDEVKKYEQSKGLSYEIHVHTQPDKYIPHLTVASMGFITTHHLNAEKVISTINQKISSQQTVQREVSDPLKAMTITQMERLIPTALSSQDVVISTSAVPQKFLPESAPSDENAMAMPKQDDSINPPKKPKGNKAYKHSTPNKAPRQNARNASVNTPKTSQPKGPAQKETVGNAPSKPVPSPIPENEVIKLEKGLNKSAGLVLECFKSNPEIRLTTGKIQKKIELPRQTILEALNTLVELELIQNLGDQNSARYQLIFRR